MKVPILKHGPHLIAVIQSELTDAELVEFRNSVADHVGRSHCRGVVVDVSALDVMDSFATRTLRSIAEVVRLCGAGAVIVGIQPSVAFAMAQLGLDLSLANVDTAMDMETGLAILERRFNASGNDGR